MKHSYFNIVKQGRTILLASLVAEHLKFSKHSANTQQAASAFLPLWLNKLTNCKQLCERVCVWASLAWVVKTEMKSNPDMTHFNQA